jgi:flavin-dependent dehydrogenase
MRSSLPFAIIGGGPAGAIAASHLARGGRELIYEDANFYAHVLPSLRAETLRESPVSGAGWAMIGYAAVLVDPITGEGLYYAMKAAELLSQALLADKPDLYPESLGDDVLPELEMAAQMADRFYTGTWMGQSVIKRTVQFHC